MNLMIITGLGAALLGCVSCNAEVREAILAHRFLLLLLTIAPIAVAGGFIAAWLARVVVRGTRDSPTPVQMTKIAWAGAMIGAGSGGLFDSILLHQILQVHDMISNSLPPVTFVAKSVNVFWGGIFDLSAIALLLLGIRSLLAAGLGLSSIPPRFFWGSFLFGWGIFNCLDALLFHGLLRYHDLVEVTDLPFVWNVGWLITGAIIAMVGLMMMRRSVGFSVAKQSTLS